MNNTLILKRRLLAQSIRIRKTSELRRSLSVKNMGVDKVSFKIANVLNPGFWKDSIGDQGMRVESGDWNVDKSYFRKGDQLVRHSEICFRHKCAFGRISCVVKGDKKIKRVKEVN